MERKIKIIQNKGFYEDRTPIVCYGFNEDLVFTFERSIGRNIVSVCEFKNRGKSATVKIEGKSIVVPKHLIDVGELEFNINNYIGDQLISKVRVETLSIIATKNGLETIPEIEEIRKKYDDLQKKFDNLVGSFKKVARIVATMGNIEIVVNEDCTIKGE